MRIIKGLIRSTKVCSKCKVLKPLSAFSKNQYSCKDCCRKFREENNIKNDNINQKDIDNFFTKLKEYEN